MKTALIGHTGFVGSNLVSKRSFDTFYNSKNFREMINQSYSDIICAGISAVKWKANKDPDNDKKQIMRLQETLSTVSAQRFILISTIDVYPLITGKDERFDCHCMKNHAYGTHRLEFEDFCRSHFPKCHIVRLPGLFGQGLKKNVIFDLLNDNCLETINPDSSFQYYCLDHLWKDIEIVINSGVDLINLFTEPIRTSKIIDRFFSGKKIGNNASAELHYDLHSVHADKWGKSGNYIYDQNDILDQIANFISNYSKKG